MCPSKRAFGLYEPTGLSAGFYEIFFERACQLIRSPLRACLGLEAKCMQSTKHQWFTMCPNPNGYQGPQAKIQQRSTSHHTSGQERHSPSFEKTSSKTSEAYGSGLPQEITGLLRA